LSAPAKAWGLVLDGLVGYGYRTWLAALWLLGFLALGTWIFAAAHPQAMTPTKPPDELPASNPSSMPWTYCCPSWTYGNRTPGFRTGSPCGGRGFRSLSGGS
jgi:hypothetical protein